MFTSGAASGSFSHWSTRAELAEAVVTDQATLAVLHMYAPEMAFLYVGDDLPEPFKRMLDHANRCSSRC
jgi:hypothetical protein